jgi:creatinine amidohydrolase
MMSDDSEISAVVRRTLERLEDHGVQSSVLVTGHVADEQLAMIETIETDWAARDSAMQVSALGLNMAGTSPESDHAGPFETSLLTALWPDLVHLDALPPLATAPSRDPGGDTRGPQRHDPTHPLYGIFGGDPRTVDPARAHELLDEVADWLARKATA